MERSKRNEGGGGGTGVEARRRVDAKLVGGGKGRRQILVGHYRR